MGGRWIASLTGFLVEILFVSEQLNRYDTVFSAWNCGSVSNNLKVLTEDQVFIFVFFRVAPSTKQGKMKS